MSIALIFVLSCEKDVLNTFDDDQQLTSRARGGNKGKPKVTPLYGVIYNGSIVTSTEGFGYGSVNRKYELIQASSCGSSMLFGVNTLVACFNSSICSPYGVALRQWDKINDPGTVYARYFFQEYPGGWFIMRGKIDENGDTIFPGSEDEVVTITFTHWWSESSKCGDTEEVAFDVAQSITVRRIDSGMCPGISEPCI